MDWCADWRVDWWISRCSGGRTGGWLVGGLLGRLVCVQITANSSVNASEPIKPIATKSNKLIKTHANNTKIAKNNSPNRVYSEGFFRV